MKLNYDRIKAKIEHGGNHWTSYSDLFLVLSVTFLLLFVVANLRSGTLSIAIQRQSKIAIAEAEELRSQMKVYDQLKEDYLGKGATQDEVKVYEELMNKIHLLENLASNERKRLEDQTKVAQEKEQDLNYYQKLIKNIINANFIASARVKSINEVVQEKENRILDQEKEISELSQTVSEQENQIAKNNDQIHKVEEELQKKINQVKQVYSQKKRSEQAMQKKIAQIKQGVETQLSSLKTQNFMYIAQLRESHEKLEEKNRDSEKLLTELQEKEQKHQQTVNELKENYQAALELESRAHQQSMDRAKTAEARLQEEKDYRQSIEQQKEKYEKKLTDLTAELEGNRLNIEKIQNQYQNSIEGLKKSNAALQKNLVASNSKINEQKILAERIQKNFKKAGIEAEIDSKTGDVTIKFQDEYFEKNQSELKPRMKQILEKLIPVYTKSLFQDPKVVKKISAVEIVGFASPTYQGKYVDPDSLSSSDRPAVNYNMDLSYRRAKSIFEYIFDTQFMSFSHQKDLLPLVKVSGRSYLASDRLKEVQRSPAEEKSYCDRFDCRKSQKVIIKFNLRDE